MAYTINLTNGTILTTIADGTVNNTASSITLIGKNYAGYGTFLNTDMVHILENFASTTAPTSPLTGQLWWDSAGNLKVYTGSTFRTLGTMTASSSAPTNSVTGNSWWDNFNQQLYIYNGSGWVLIGPAFTSNTGQSGTIVGTISDSVSVNHVAVNVYVSNTLVSIISKDSEYTPQTVISGFTTIKPGFNLSTAIANIAFVGTATDASKLGSIAAANYARTDIATSFANTVSVNNNSGLTVGSSNNFTVGVNGSLTTLTNNVNNANVAIIANVSGSPFTAITVDGTTGSTVIANLVTSGAFNTTGYLYTDYNQNATSNVTGAVRVPYGGIGVAGNVFTSNSFVASGNVVVTGQVGATGNISTSNYLFVTGSEDATSNTTGAVRISGGMSVQGDIRAVGNVRAKNFIGVASEALYADLAERFESDSRYAPGTVVRLGGEKEITMETQELSDLVFGVVSANPAYLMNAESGTNETHPPIALSGRVPVRVLGIVKKHDRLVSAGNGLARSAIQSEITPFNVIGRALESKTTVDEGMIDAIVLLNK